MKSNINKVSKWKKLTGLTLAMFTTSIAANEHTFPLVQDGKAVSINVDQNAFPVVKIAANLLARDIKSITDIEANIANFQTGTLPAGIVVATLGVNPEIDAIAKQNGIDTDALSSNWETYSWKQVNNDTLLIVGSDRRGAAYGLLEISRKLGVSPWEWWADVTPAKQAELSLSFDDHTSKSPSVKYRGIFLNDEDWGLQEWAELNWEPEVGDMGPKTYGKIFELMLRLRANTVWPAMHTSTKPFYSYPDNKVVADQYAVIIGTSHAEPMLSNINTEWDQEKYGEWRYDTNSETIKTLFNKRTEEAAPYENIFTMGMRGKHDDPMIAGADDTGARVKLLEKVITDQRSIIANKIDKPVADVPQVFIPYKEVLKYYQNGLEVPEDITLMWTDDNYGYIRQLSTPAEQQRAGGAGIYYHTSYWGRPHDYLWLNSTSPALMWQEMYKAYEFQARDMWVLNVGDIKPHEYNTELFLDMAWDMDKFGHSNAVTQHIHDWATREFGAEYAQDVTELTEEFYRLAFIRRPEFMAWSQVEPVTKSGKTQLSQIHYNDEVGQRIAEYQALEDQVEALYKKVQKDIPARKDAFYQLVYYPTIGATAMNKKWLYHFKNKYIAQQGRSSATWFAEQSKQAYDRIMAETKYYNDQMAGGKWQYIMTPTPRKLPVFSEPTYSQAMSNGETELSVALEGYQMEMNHDIENSHADVLPVFNAYSKNKYYVDLFSKGEFGWLSSIDWQATPEADWIKLSANKGTLDSDNPEQRLWVTIDWDKVPAAVYKKEPPLGHDFQLIPPSYKVNSSFTITTGDKSYQVGVSVYNPKFKQLENFKGFVEDKGFVSINAENYHSKSEGGQASWNVLSGLGYSGKVISPWPVNADVITENIKQTAPYVEYEFYSFNFGDADVILQAIPTHPSHEGRGVRMAVAIDDAEPVIVDFATKGRSPEWKQNVLANAARASAKQVVNQAGKHTLKVWMVDPGVMLDQILIDLGGWKTSYQFPIESSTH